MLDMDIAAGPASAAALGPSMARNVVDVLP